ncbi:hypothetical protein ACHQM5_012028 [Ranunculus cassubicifolius]
MEGKTIIVMFFVLASAFTKSNANCFFKCMDSYCIKHLHGRYAPLCAAGCGAYCIKQNAPSITASSLVAANSNSTVSVYASVIQFSCVECIAHNCTLGSGGKVCAARCEKACDNERD